MKSGINLEKLNERITCEFVNFINERYISLKSLDSINILLPYKFLKAVSIQKSFNDNCFAGLSDKEKDEVIKEAILYDNLVKIDIIGTEYILEIVANISYHDAIFSVDLSKSDDETIPDKWLISISATPLEIQHLVNFMWGNGHFFSFNMQCSKSK